MDDFSCFCTRYHCGHNRANIDGSMLPIVFSRDIAVGTLVQTLADRCLWLFLHATQLGASSCTNQQIDVSNGFYTRHHYGHSCATISLLLRATSPWSTSYKSPRNNAFRCCTRHSRKHPRADIDRSMCRVDLARGTTMGTFAQTSTGRCYRLSLHAKPLWASSYKHQRIDASRCFCTRHNYGHPRANIEGSMRPVASSRDSTILPSCKIN